MVRGLVAGLQMVLGSGNKLSDLGAAPDPRGDLQPLVNAFTAVVIGGTVLTAGRYLWRGARRRGWRHRLGRVLAILGYLDTCATLVVFNRVILAALGTKDADSSTQVVLHGLVVCLLISLPGVALAMTGFRLANETPLMTTEVKAHF